MNASELPPAVSLTHLHLLAAVHTELLRLPPGPVRVYDMGCGDGRFLAYLVSCIQALMPESSFEFFGVDVADSGLQPEEFFAVTVARLTEAHPVIDWAARLHLITSGDAWPFANGFLSVVTSNQVLEHVFDHAFFKAEHYRVLRDDGFGFHVFPFKHYVYKGHLNLPPVHRIGQYRRIKSYIAMCSNLGLSKYHEDRDKYGMTIDAYSEEHAVHMVFMTNYLLSGECLDVCKYARLRADLRATK